MSAERRRRRAAASTTSGAAGIKLGAVGGVTLVSSVTWFVFGGVGILIVVIATDVFNGGDAATGYLNGAIGIGGTIGALLAGALVLRPRLGRPLLLGAFAFGAATLLLGVANTLLAAFVAITVAVGRQPRHRRHRHDDLPARRPRRVPRPVRRR